MTREADAADRSWPSRLRLASSIIISRCPSGLARDAALVVVLAPAGSFSVVVVFEEGRSMQ